MPRRCDASIPHSSARRGPRSRIATGRRAGSVGEHAASASDIAPRWRPGTSRGAGGPERRAARASVAGSSRPCLPSRMLDPASVSFWLETSRDDLTTRPALDGSIEADVAILGAGYTGLWTAYYLLRRDPSLRVVVLEREVAGFGASGRNGAWCAPDLNISMSRLARLHGDDAAHRMQQATYDAVDEVGRVCAEEGIDAGSARAAQLIVARGTQGEPTIERELPRVRAIRIRGPLPRPRRERCGGARPHRGRDPRAVDGGGRGRPPWSTRPGPGPGRRAIWRPDPRATAVTDWRPRDKTGRAGLRTATGEVRARRSSSPARRT